MVFCGTRIDNFQRLSWFNYKMTSHFCRILLYQYLFTFDINISFDGKEMQHNTGSCTIIILLYLQDQNTLYQQKSIFLTSLSRKFMKFLMIPNIGACELIIPAKLIKILAFWTETCTLQNKQFITFLVFNILLLGQLFIDENYGHTYSSKPESIKIQRKLCDPVAFDIKVHKLRTHTCECY